jgi:hypothetical protein
LLKAAARPRKTSLRRRFAKWVSSVVDWLVRAWVLKEFRARGAGLVVTSACPGLCIGLLPPSETNGRASPSCLRAFSALPDFLSSFHARPGNVHIEEMLLCAAKLGGGAGSDSVLEIS